MNKRKMLFWIIVLAIGGFILLVITQIDLCGATNNANSSDNKNSNSNISHKHSWEKIDYREPTCEEAGYIFWKCDICEETDIDTIHATGHSKVIDPAVEPSCTNTGLTEGAHCLECGKVLIQQYILPKTNHVEVIDPAIEASCEEPGLTEGVHCLECGEILIQQQIIPSHNFVGDMCEDCNSNYYTAGLKFTLLDDGGSYKVSIGDAVDSNIVVPAIYKGKPVTLIEDNAFADCKMIKNITIPNTVSSIGFGAFKNCDSLEKITLPFIGTTNDSNINNHFGYIFGASNFENQFSYIPPTLIEVIITNEQTIDDNQFDTCNFIKKISLNNGITSIGIGAFNACISLEEINIPDTVTTIGESAFKDCSSLKDLELPFGLEKIGDSAFYSCGALRNIVVPDSVVFIGHYAFYGCYLDSITIPFVGETLEDTKNTHFSFIFGVSASQLPKNLTKVIITRAKFIDDEAFLGCHYIESIILPNTIVSVGDKAFYGCSALMSITIPNSVTSIGEDILTYCENLTTITIPFIGEKLDNPINMRFGYLFGGNGIVENEYFVPSALKEVIITNALHIYDYSFSGCSNIETITLSDSVTSIGKFAFLGCESLINFTLGKNINFIDENAFQYCGRIKNLYYKGSIEEWCKIDLVNRYSNPFSMGNTGTALYLLGEYDEYYLLENVIIPNTVTIIGEYTFYNCDSIKTIEISEGVTEIREYAFAMCGDLDSIIIPNTVMTIGEYAFYYNYIETIELSEGLIEIGEYAFSNNGYLKKIIIPNTVKTVGKNAFYDCYQLRELVIGRSVSNIGNKAFYECPLLESIIVDEGNKNYDSRNNCNAIIESASNTLILGCKNTIMPNDIKVIGSYAFYKSGLSSIELSEGLIEIEEYAFYNCSLTRIVIPDTVTTIGEFAFYSCLLETLIIGSGVNSIGACAFAANGTLQCIMVDINNEHYDSRNNCNAIIEKGWQWNALVVGCQNTEIPNDVTYIGSYAFEGVNTLKTLVIPESVTKIGKYAFRGSSLINIVIPKSVTYIDDGAFERCHRLTRVFIPNTVTYIGDYVFRNCERLTIYCEAESEPEGWAYWDYNKEYNVVWGVKEYNIITQNGIQYMLKDVEAIIIGYLGGSTELTIPSTIMVNTETYLVTEIAQYAFYRCDELTSVTIGENIIKIGRNAFSSCSNLSQVVIGNGVKEIEDGAFYWCSSLKNVFIPINVQTLGDSVFENILDNVLYCEAPYKPDGWHIDWNGEYNRNLYWGVSKDGFIQIDGIHYLLQNGEVIITKYTGSETNVNIPSVIEINGEIYEITGIGDSAFAYSTLSSVYIPDSITHIDSFAFYDCESLTSIFIPGSVTNIGSDAFTKRKVLTIYCEVESKPSGWHYNFNGSKNYNRADVYWGMTRGSYIEIDGLHYLIKNNSATIVFYTGDKDFVDIPSKIRVYGIDYAVIAIGKGAFSEHEIHIVTMFIPSSIKKIENNFIEYHSNLTIYCEVKSKPVDWGIEWTRLYFPVYWGISRNNLIQVDDYQYILKDNNASITMYLGDDTVIEIPRTIEYEGKVYNVTSLENFAFYRRSDLTSIFIHSDITEIKEDTFDNTDLVLYIEIEEEPNGWDVYWDFGVSAIYWGVSKNNTLEIDSFHYLIKNNEAILTKYTGKSEIIEIPSTIKVNEVTYNVTAIGKNAFESCYNLMSIKISNNITKIGNSAFENCNKLKKLIIPDNVEIIGDNAFRYCHNLTSIVIGSGVKTIGNRVFNDCYNVKSIIVSVENKNYDSRNNCNAIIETITNTLVAGCQNTIIPDGVLSIGKSAFEGINTLKILAIPYSVVSIGSQAFEGCKGLHELFIPISVSIIEEYSFNNCSNLTIYCEAQIQPKEWNSQWNISNCLVYWGVSQK